MNDTAWIKELARLKLENEELRYKCSQKQEQFESFKNKCDAVLNETCEYYEGIIERLKGTNRKGPSSIPHGEGDVGKENCNTQYKKRAKSDTEQLPSKKRKAQISKQLLKEAVIEAPHIEESKPFAITKGELNGVCFNAIQSDSLEEMLYHELGSKITEANAQLVVNTLFSLLLNSASSMRSVDDATLIQRCILYSRCLFYIITQFQSIEAIETFLDQLSNQILQSLNQKEHDSCYLHTLHYSYYLLSKWSHATTLHYRLFYRIMIAQGAFPLHGLYIIWKDDPEIWMKSDICKDALNCIIGVTLTSNREVLSDYADMISYYEGKGIDWGQCLTETEVSSLQILTDSVNYSSEVSTVYSAAMESLVLLYLYHGGEYCVASLIDNGLIENLENEELSTDYRRIILQLVLILAKVDFFGEEWKSIRPVLKNCNLYNDLIYKEYNSYL